MDLKAITTILTSHEDIFRNIITSAKRGIDGDALKAKLTSHYINLVVISRNRYPQSSSTIDDPIPSLSRSSSPSPSPTSNNKKRGRGEPSGRTSQLTAKPFGRSTQYSRPMQPAGASQLFGSKSKKGIAIPVINLLGSDDDSAGSAESDSDSMFVSPTSPSSARKSERFASRSEKEAERKRGRSNGMRGVSQRMEIPESWDEIESESESEIQRERRSGNTNEMSTRKRVVVEIDARKPTSGESENEAEEERERHRGSSSGMSGRKEISDEDAAGFEGGKDGVENDWAMEELIQYADDEAEKDKEMEEVAQYADDEREAVEVQEGSPSKRRRSS